jgi:MFS family permease
MNELPARFEPGSSKAKMTWFGALCIAGVGMFVEAYIIITTGQVKTIWKAQYPECLAHSAVCPNLVQCCGVFSNEPLTNGVCVPEPGLCQADGTYPSGMVCNSGITGALSYVEFAGIMVGMLTFGKLADMFGRTRAGIIAALLQVVGVTLMAFYSSNNLNKQWLIFDIFYGIFGLGVGGEYPLTATNAAAHHAESLEDALMDDEERHRHRVMREKERTARRGETIAIVFSMQGVGAVVGSVFLLILIYFGYQERPNW